MGSFSFFETLFYLSYASSYASSLSPDSTGISWATSIMKRERDNRKKWFLSFGMIGLLALTLFQTACTTTRPVLRVLAWEDYIDPGLIVAFEKKYDCRVVVDTYQTNKSVYVKLEAGLSGYDMLITSSYMAAIMERDGMLEELDQTKIPNLKHIDREYLQHLALDKTMAYSVPYMLSNTGIAYLKSKVPDFRPSWGMLESEDIRDRATLMDDMRETMGAALKYLGYSLNSRNEVEIEEAKNLVLKWKKTASRLDSSYYRFGLAAGEFILVHGYSGDVLQVMDRNEDIVFVQPVEGTSISCDDLVILKKAKNKELAYAFIDFLHEPAHAARNTAFVFYLCPNRASYEHLAEDLRGNSALFVPEEILLKSEIIRDLGEDNKKYIKAWAEIRVRQP